MNITSSSKHTLGETLTNFHVLRTLLKITEYEDYLEETRLFIPKERKVDMWERNPNSMYLYSGIKANVYT